MPGKNIEKAVFGVRKNLLPASHVSFMEAVEERMSRGLTDNKLSMEKLAASYLVFDKNQVKELIELVIVNAARKVAQQKNKSIAERYREMVHLYEKQVNLSHRTSQSILLQQYSTPAPIGFLAGIFCGVDQFNTSNGKIGFEPSAGNGLLTIAAHPSQFVVNEIDQVRHLHLQSQQYKKVYRLDATKPFAQTLTDYQRFDAVITNPPFGKAEKKVEFNGYPIGTLEHVMTLRALDLLKNEGKAAIIIGQHTRYDDKKRVQAGAQRIFLNYLYHHYHVADIIPINGAKLYSRQGTSFDTRLILISGRKPQPSGAAPLYDTYRETEVKRFDDLYDRVMEAMTFSTFEYATSDHSPLKPTTMKDSGLEKTHTRYRAWKKKQEAAIVLIRHQEDYVTFEKDALLVSQVSGLPILNHFPHPLITFPAEQADLFLQKLTRSGHAVVMVDELQLPEKRQPIQAAHLKDAFSDLETELEAELKRLKQGTDLGAPYLPASEACVVLNTVVPDSMEYETKQALDFIQEEVGGNMDEFVRQRLGYGSKLELCKALSAEQTDAVAMAIYNIEAREQGMIIGDQTGIGKGRVAAAMIRYAVLQGHKPVFITEKPNLFSDLYRDLIAIGSGDLVPFIVNGKEGKTDIKDENGDILYQALAPSEQQVFFKDQRLPVYCHFVLATYSQFNSPDRKPEKPQFLLEVAKDTVLILDESHNASGSSQVGEFLQRVLSRSKGVVFLSATFAKRPDNMPIYAMKTAISDANMTIGALVGAILKGGVALQEVLASQLVKEGQMLRRERSFEGVEVNYLTLDELATEQKAIADNVTEVLRDIIAFQKKSVDKMVNDLDEIAVAEGKEVKLREGTSQAGVDNLPYFSKVFQVIHQMLFSIKATAVADRAIMRLKEGKKPVIAFASTMGSFVEQMENEHGLPINNGDTINTDFSQVLMRGLDGILRYTITTPEGNKEFKKFEVADLAPDARLEYLRIAARIKDMTSGISISPIDIIVQRLTLAGYRVAEVTGRKYEVQINPKTNQGLVKLRNKINTNDAFRRFNNNEVDVLMINQSGSTGASAHAIVTKTVPASEVKQRVMIVLQAELDINTEVQKRGRINRTGQILLPIYDYVMSAIPAENRLMMMLQKKLKSLDANTSSNQKQSTKILDVPDFLNKYGDKIVTQYLVENLEINALLGDPLGITEKSEPDILEDAAHKVSGRVAVLSTTMQSEFYTEISQSYMDYVDYLKQIGDYDLEVEAMNLEAETLSQRVVRMGKGGDSEFGTDSILEKIEANVLRKPFSKTELENILKESLAGRDPKDSQRDLINDLTVFSQAWLDKGIAEHQAYYEDLMQGIKNEKKGLKIKEKDGETAYLEFIASREKELQAAQSKQLQKIHDQAENRKAYLIELFQYFLIGKNLEYPINTFADGGVKVKAVFLGFILDKRKKNPYAPSNIRLRFALANSNKYIALPASYTKDIQAIMGVSHKVKQESLEELLSSWEQAIKASTKNRSIRYVITGNILQAFTDFNGKLVSYTTIQGEIKKGILMPEYWDSLEEMSDKVTVPVSRAYKVIASITKGNTVTTENGTSIVNMGDTYKIIVAASRQKGGDVFLDPDVLTLVEDQNFNKVADKMVTHLPHQALKAFLSILQTKFNDSLTISMSQFNLIKHGATEHQERHPIKLLTPEEVEEEDHLHLLALNVEVELEMELELMRLQQAA